MKRGVAAGTNPAAAHFIGMIRPVLAAALLFVLAGCIPTAEVPALVAAAPPLPSTSRDPDVVLRAWADAVERRDWAAVRAFWGDHGARSGLSEAAFTQQWSGLKHPNVSLSKGDGEGAAGSLYYTAPVRIIDGSRVISGEIVIRRVNDVDGASAELLRWHVESTTLTP